MCLLTLLNVWTHVNLQVVFRLMGSIMWWCGSYVYVWKNSFMLALGHKMIIQMPFWVVMDRLSFLTFKWLTSLSFLYFHLLQFWRDQEMLRQLYWSLQQVWKVCFVFSCRPCCFEVIYILKTLCSRGVHNFHNLIVFLKCVLILFFFFPFSYPVSKLSPKKWGVSGSSSVVLVAFLGGVSFLLSQGIDVRPNLAAILGLAFMDSIFLGGSCLAQISSYWPPNRRRILVHEAGHLLTGKS